MGFQTRGTTGFLSANRTQGQGQPSSSPTEAPTYTQNSVSSGSSIEALINQISEAVRERLLSQGVPLQIQNGSQNPKAEVPSWHQLIHHGADRIGHLNETPFQPHLLNGDQTLASRIDHTLLKPDATKQEIEKICEEARKYKFATVCVNSTWVGLAAELLKGSGVKAIAVVGFPLGAAATATKSFEAREAIKVGAAEIDMVLNIGAMKSREYNLVFDDIKKVVEASTPYPVKVILETSNLTIEEKIIACAFSKAAGAAFVKTSTGFGSGGATVEDIALMRKIVGPEMGVKASGGIRTFEDATKMIEAGATRIGASASISIVLHESKGNTKEPVKSDSAKKPYKTSLY